MNKIATLIVLLMSNTTVKYLKITYPLSWILRIFFSCQISPGISIGKNFVLGYGGLGVVIHGQCKIGNNCTIAQNVTIGGNFGSNGVPIISDNVYVATGAKILGNISIGENCIIGANAVVTKNVEENSVMAGVPARLIRKL